MTDCVARDWIIRPEAGRMCCAAPPSVCKTNHVKVLEILVPYSAWGRLIELMCIAEINPKVFLKRRTK